MKSFFVWRRNDGHIGVTTYMPRDYITGGSEPIISGGERPGFGLPVTFERLAEFDEFENALFYTNNLHAPSTNVR